jgi:putative multicomponent Na+:H+ antiporter subunit B
MSDWLDIFIAALLPLTAVFAVVQTRPWFALLSRGMMGVVAVLFYAVMGAPDVALTEALVGTLLTVILFAIAVRSSLAVRVGILDNHDEPPKENVLRTFCRSQQLYLRWTTFPTEKELAAALKAGRVDAVCATADSIPSLHSYLSSSYSSDQHVVLLAEHCRWHERKMNSLYGEAEQVERLIYREKRSAC